MLQITIPEMEAFDDNRNEFITLQKQVLTLEHSLVSISKWESETCIPFLSNKNLTVKQTIDYVRCMSISKNIDDSLYDRLTDDNINDIRKYIECPMTATRITNKKTSINRDIITSEIIYYWMVSFNIPFECEKWHLNRLLTLIEVCDVKNSPGKKMSKKEVLSNNATINAARKKALNTKG